MNAFILLAEGFEDIEMIVPLDILRRAGGDVKMLAVGDDLTVSSSHQVNYICDGLLKDYIDLPADVIITPGGMPGSTHLSASPLVKSVLRRQAEANRFIASICAAPLALDSAGVLGDHQYTCYPGVEAAISSGRHRHERLVVDGKLITAMGPGVALDFGLKIVELLIGSDVAAQLKSAMLIA